MPLPELSLKLGKSNTGTMENSSRNLPAVESADSTITIKFGYLPDIPDARDYTREKAGLAQKKQAQLPAKADLRAFCPQVFDQGRIGACTANAASGLLGYYLRRAMGKDNVASRMFIYKGTRDLMQAKGDSGAYIRTTMGALALFGACPEKYWEYDESALDAAPPAFCYSFAQNYQAMTYFRLDEKSVGIPKMEKADVLLAIKETIAQGIPAMFGFAVFESIKEANGGKIPYPARGEKQLGGHAVLCVGYDDEMAIGSSKGAFIIRNSWGEAWGEKGYGYLPYDYLMAGLAQDWWSLVKAEWMETGEFGV